MRVCRDLPAGFVGIGSEKSIDVAVRDNGYITEIPGFNGLTCFIEW